MADSSPTPGLETLQLSDTAMIVDPEELASVDEKSDVAILDPEPLDANEPEAGGEPEPPLLRADNRTWSLSHSSVIDRTN